MSEETFRERVYREARAAGYDDRLARLIADSCRDPDDSNARMAGIAALYGAAHLTEDFLRQKVPFTEAFAILEKSARGAVHLDAAGTFRVRSMLQQRQFT
jgi:hypothetical protein